MGVLNAENEHFKAEGLNIGWVGKIRNIVILELLDKAQLINFSALKF